MIQQPNLLPTVPKVKRPLRVTFVDLFLLGVNLKEMAALTEFRSIRSKQLQCECPGNVFSCELRMIVGTERKFSRSSSDCVAL